MLTLVAGNLIDGHTLLSDWLLLIAAIVFALAAVIAAVVAPAVKAWQNPTVLLAAGLAVVSVALLVV